MDQPLWLQLLEMGCTAAAGFLGGRLTSFWYAFDKKKAENLATHEDIDKLVDQMEAVTDATKRIEGQISHEYWRKQKAWEIKKEAIFECLREIGNVSVTMPRLIGVLCTPMPTSGDTTKFVEMRRRSRHEYLQAFSAAVRAKMLADLVCGPEVQDMYSKFLAYCMRIADAANSGGLEDARALLKDATFSIEQLISTIRLDLERSDFTHQSTQSSATPSPAAPTQG